MCLMVILPDDNIVGKINGILGSLFILDIIDEPITIIFYFEVDDLKNSIEEYLAKR